MNIHHESFPQATTGITYDNFSAFMGKLVRPEDGPEPFATVERNKYAMDTLYRAVRLREWRPSLSITEPGFEIWDKQNSIRFLVTQKKVEFATGMSLKDSNGIRRYKITEGLAASNLFHSIKHAQELIRVALNNSDISVPDDEFFKPQSKEEQAAQIDPVLAEPQTEEVSTAPVWQRSIEPQYMIAVDDVPGIEAKGAPEKDGIKQYTPPMYEKQVQNHFKSLQGRILTIVDASLADKQQREAVKTLVNKEFRRQMEKVGGFFLDPRCAQSDGE